ncbi:AGAP011506-PA, partial [Anopheles gambiae str. PEST]
CQFLFLLEKLFAVTVAVSATDDAFNIELKQKDAEVYHEQSFGKNEFNYGYQVERTNSQFQHKVKGPDDVTYGCYGYIDPVGEKHLVYYIADRLGYRLLAPDQPTKVFTDRVANSLDADLQGRKLDEKVVAWNDLYLPSTCRRLDEIVSITLPPTTAAPVLP